MKLDGSIVVVTRGTSAFAVALAESFSALGAIVILCDKNKKALLNRANEFGAMSIATDPTCEVGIKNLIEKTIHRFGRIDLFVSNASYAEPGYFLNSEKDWNPYWQSDAMAQMYAAKYALPQMIQQGNGYLLNMIPSTGLFTEFRSDLYSTLSHPSFSFAERMAKNYRKAGIKVSVFCSDFFPSIAWDFFTMTPADTQILRNLTESVVGGVQQEQFIILPDILKMQTQPFREYNANRIRNLPP